MLDVVCFLDYQWPMRPRSTFHRKFMARNKGMKFNFLVFMGHEMTFMGYSLEIHGILIEIWFIVVVFNKP